MDEFAEFSDYHCVYCPCRLDPGLYSVHCPDDGPCDCVVPWPDEMHWTPE